MTIPHACLSISRRCLALALLVTLGCHGWRRSNDDDGFDMRALVAGCPRYARILAGGYEITQPQNDSVRDAYESIRFCDGWQSALAAAWRNPPTDTFTLSILTARSSDVEDRNLLKVILPIAADTSRPLQLRRAAIQTVVEQYKPGVTVYEDTRVDPPRIILSQRTHAEEREKRHPLTESDRERIRDAFAQMALSDPNARVRAMTRAIARALTPAAP